MPLTMRFMLLIFVGVVISGCAGSKSVSPNNTKLETYTAVFESEKSLEATRETLATWLTNCHTFDMALVKTRLETPPSSSAEAASLVMNAYDRSGNLIGAQMAVKIEEGKGTGKITVSVSVFDYNHTTRLPQAEQWVNFDNPTCATMFWKDAPPPPPTHQSNPWLD